jgi:hypothetical protein
MAKGKTPLSSRVKAPHNCKVQKFIAEAFEVESNEERRAVKEVKGSEQGGERL